MKPTRNTVLGQRIGIEEGASLVRAVWCRMARVVTCHLGAVGSTNRGIIALVCTICVKPVPQEGVLTQGILGRLDGSSKGRGACIARNGWGRSGFVVRIGTSDDYGEARTHVSSVGSLSSRDN